MSEIFSGSIDLNKIDKTKVVEGKNGQKYYNVQVSINDTVDQYGNIGSIIENQSKEQRERKDKKVYLGNVKSVWKSNSSATTNVNGKTYPVETVPPIDDGTLPF